MVNTIAGCFWLCIIILEKQLVPEAVRSVGIGDFCTMLCIYVSDVPSYFQAASPESKERRNNSQDHLNCNEHNKWYLFLFMYFSALAR